MCQKREVIGVAGAGIEFVGDGVALGGGPGGNGVWGEGNWNDAAAYHYVVYSFPFVVVEVTAFWGGVISVIGEPEVFYINIIRVAKAGIAQKGIVIFFLVALLITQVAYKIGGITIKISAD